jgi:hypothetical protein
VDLVHWRSTPTVIYTVPDSTLNSTSSHDSAVVAVFSFIVTYNSQNYKIKLEEHVAGSVLASINCRNHIVKIV